MAELVGRTLSQKEYMRLIGAFRVLVKRGFGGLDAASLFTRLSVPQLGRMQVPQGGQFPPADVIADLEREGDFPHVTQALARLQGYELAPLPGVDGGVWGAHLADLHREFADVIQKVGQALADDGDITADEVAEGGLIDEVDQVIAVACAFKRALQDVTEADG